MDLLDELETRVLCGDGAIGSLLLEAGIPLTRCLEELCISEPDRIRPIHEEYIRAGARVIETNSFGANAVRLGRFGFQERVAEINRAAAKRAQEAAGTADVYVAGSVGPLGITGEEAARRGIDRAGCFREQVGSLLEGGVDLIYFETFTDFEEMAIALRAKKELGDVPEICSFACAPDGQLSDISLAGAFAKLQAMGAKMMGVNCMNDPHGMVQLLRQLPGEHLLAVYPSAGNPREQGGRFVYDAGPERFAEVVREMVAKGGRLLGGCCGTTPAHIAALAGAIAELPSGEGGRTSR
ncbi:MAG: homocysteine S-methyltransferase family protein [Chthoniobacterales bacterium]